MQKIGIILLVLLSGFYNNYNNNNTIKTQMSLWKQNCQSEQVNRRRKPIAAESKEDNLEIVYDL